MSAADLADFVTVISGECFGCKQEMNRYLVGVLIHRPYPGGAAALCSACLDRAAGMVLDHWRNTYPSVAAAGSGARSDVTKKEGGSDPRCAATIDGGRCAGLRDHEGEHYANARERGGGR